MLVDDDLPEPEVSQQYRTFRTTRRYRGRFAAYEDAFALRRDVELIRPRLFHSPTLALPAALKCPLVVTLHDLIPWVLGSKYRRERMRFALARRLLRNASVVLAVSRSTASDALRVAGIPEARVEVIYPGLPVGFHPIDSATDRVADAFGVTGGYFLHVGALEPRRDPIRLLQAWKSARVHGSAAALVLAGDLGRRAPEMPGAISVGRVSLEDLNALMCAARCLLFSSRYEGFGFPLLEAMAAGCPVVAYNNSSVPEVVGSAGVLVHDGDADALGAAAAEVDRDEDKRAQLQHRGFRQASRFSWSTVARRTVAVYRRLLA